MDGAVADEAQWADARRRAAVIARTLPDAPADQRLSLTEAARELCVDRSTVCRWRARFDAERRVSALLRGVVADRRGTASSIPRSTK